MNLATNQHPNDGQLTDFGLGKLSPDESLWIEKHLDECDECNATLVNLHDDTFAGVVRSLGDKPVAGFESPADDNLVEDRETNSLASNSLNTEAGRTDGAVDDADASHSVTVLVSSRDPGIEADIPEELRSHARYRIVELIGRGGMGDVYRAEHRLMNRPVALKLINSQLIQHPQAIERFRREVQAAARLQHPNIVTAYDAEQAGDIHFFVMEFVDGIDLAALVKQRGSLPVAEASEYIRQAALGLQHAHEKGMVHRDIKPHNLMLEGRESRAAGQEPSRPQPAPLGSQPSVKILDFGLAGFATGVVGQAFQPDPNEPLNSQFTSVVERSGQAGKPDLQLTTIGSVMGTPDYIAPEQVRDAHSADIRADIYSLGCTLYFLLTGQPPFTAGNVVGKLKAHAEQTPPLLSDLRSDVPRELSDIAAKMLSKQPAERFAEPREVAAALAPFAEADEQRKIARQSGRTSRRKPAAPLSPAARLARTLAALAGVVLLGALIVVGTARGRVVIESQVGDVEVIVRQGGERIAILDTATGSRVTWVPTGDVELELVGRDNSVKLDQSRFEMSRLGKVIVTVRWDTSQLATIRSFDSATETITRDGVETDEGGWKVTATGTRTVRLFEVPLPAMQPGPFFYRARLKSENVVGRAYLEMWVRFPGHGEFFSKGLFNAVSGTNGWAEYEIPFLLEASKATGQIDPAPDQVKLNLVVEGSGTVWIKDVELRGRRIDVPRETEADLPSRSASQNLLTDPSFENTPLTQLPEGWRGWFNDGTEFRCEVVKGGHTGQRCLQIAGKGTRGVVFANDLKADRTKRYALKGWVKFEGDKDARALIKLNYFRGGEFLGVHDLVGATADQPGWHLFEKTDALDAFPTADHFYAMCHVEGSGTGWFDDLELVAYDRDKLPADFDVRHGRHNRLHGPNSLHRWVGTWETEYVFRETDNAPNETRLTMTTVNERILGDYFLMSHTKAAPVTPTDRQPTPADPPANSAAMGDEERLLFLTFDQNLGAFRQWSFGSNGKSFEWRGPWNNETQTLELRMLPDASNLHSSEHFVDDDHIEARLKFQYVMGERDAGRWTATRKARDGKVDVPAVNAPVAEPAELALLNKHVGEWTIHAKYKQSVWNPEPREETATEVSEWVLGGRFLMTRSFNEKGEFTALWLATCDPLEKSHRAWFFYGDGASSQWRISWDEATREFHWQATDMPSGWSGSVVNRWIDDDTFDNRSLIKDEQGRVLLDGTQDKRRKK